MLILRVLSFLLCVATNLSLGAEPLARAKIKQATGSIIRQKDMIQTGSNSRIELKLPDSATVRLGSNTDFRFTPDYKELDLNKGTLMASLLKGSSDVIIRAGGVVVMMAGNGSGTLEMSNIGGNAKLIVLSGKILATLTKNPNQTKMLRYGQMLNVPTNTTTIPAISGFKLNELIKTSVLFNMGDFPGARAVRQNATKQQGPLGLPSFVTGGFDPVIQTTIGPAGTAAIVSHEEQQQQATQQRQATLVAQQQQQQQQQQAVLERNRQQAAQALALAAAVRAAQQRAAQEAAAQQAAQQASQAAQGQGQGSQGQGQGSQGGSNPGNPNNGNQGNQGQGGGQGRPSQLPARPRPNPPIAKPM